MSPLYSVNLRCCFSDTSSRMNSGLSSGGAARRSAFRACAVPQTPVRRTSSGDANSGDFQESAPIAIGKATRKTSENRRARIIEILAIWANGSREKNDEDDNQHVGRPRSHSTMSTRFAATPQAARPGQLQSSRSHAPRGNARPGCIDRRWRMSKGRRWLALPATRERRDLAFPRGAWERGFSTSQFSWRRGGRHTECACYVPDRERLRD